MCREAGKTLYREKQRALFIEAHTKGFTNADIAQLLGMSPNYVNNCASCADAFFSGVQMDEFARKCGLSSALMADAARAGYVLYKLPIVTDPADVLLAAAEVKREESEDGKAVADVLIKLKNKSYISEQEKAAFRQECEETIARRLELIAAVEGL